MDSLMTPNPVPMSHRNDSVIEHPFVMIPANPVAKSHERYSNAGKHDHTISLLGLRAVLGDGLCALRHGVLGELTGEDESDRGLDFSR